MDFRSQEDILRALQESLKKGESIVDEYKIPESERMKEVWEAGTRDGRQLVKEIFESPGNQGIYGERLRGYEPSAAEIEEFLGKSPLGITKSREKTEYTKAFVVACREGWPRQDN